MNEISGVVNEKGGKLMYCLDLGEHTREEKRREEKQQSCIKYFQNRSFIINSNLSLLSLVFGNIPEESK